MHLKGFSIGGEVIVSRLIVRDRPRPTSTGRVRPRPTASDRVRPRPTATDRDRPRPTLSYCPCFQHGGSCYQPGRRRPLLYLHYLQLFLTCPPPPPPHHTHTHGLSSLFAPIPLLIFSFFCCCFLFPSNQCIQKPRSDQTAPKPSVKQRSSYFFSFFS